MVLSPSAAHDAPRAGPPGWLRRLKVSLELSRSGLLLLVDHACPERLGELVRALLPIAPELEVHTEAQRMAEVTPGSTIVLLPRVEDADWLNLNRPLFASRQLRVVLFCTREVSVALTRGAVDFVDWMSLRVDCPPGPAPFAVAGLRAALAARVPGIVWTGGDLEASFAAARPRRKLRSISAARPYAELVAEARRHRGEWLAWTEVDGEFRLRRVRWALAEAKRRTPSLLVGTSVGCPGWFDVHGRVMEPHEARACLVQAGAQWPGRLASLADLEPESVDLLSRLLQHGVPETTLEEELRREVDPGRHIGGLSIARGLIAENDLTRGKALPPAMRAFAAMPDRARTLLASELSRIGQRMGEEAQLTAEDAFWWSAWTEVLASPVKATGFTPRAETVEAPLRNNPRTDQLWEALATLALSARDVEVAYHWARQLEEANPAKWGLLIRVLQEEGRLIEAEALLRQRLAEDKQISYVDRAWIHHTLSYVLHEKGEDAEAEKLLKQTLANDKRTLGPQHRDSATSLHLLAEILSSQGKYTEAEKLLRQSLTMLRQMLGKQHPDAISLLRDLSEVLEAQGRYREAEKSLRECMRLQERTIGPLDPAYARSMYSLAWLLQQQSQYESAEKMLLRALTIMEQSLGVHHPDYAAALHDLAGLRIWQDRLAEAEDLLLRSRSIKEQTLGPRSGAYATSLHDLARVRRRQGRYTEAEDLMRQAVNLQAEIFGTRNPEYAKSLHQLALMIDAQGRYSEAEEALRHSLDVLEHALGAQHSELGAPLHILGHNLMKQGRFQEAESYLVRALLLAQKNRANNHPTTALVLVTLAQVEHALGKRGAAKRAQQAIEALRRAYGPEHPTTQQALPLLRQIVEAQDGKQR